MGIGDGTEVMRNGRRRKWNSTFLQNSRDGKDKGNFPAFAASVSTSSVLSS